MLCIHSRRSGLMIPPLIVGEQPNTSLCVCVCVLIDEITPLVEVVHCRYAGHTHTPPALSQPSRWNTDGVLVKETEGRLYAQRHTRGVILLLSDAILVYFCVFYVVFKTITSVYQHKCMSCICSLLNRSVWNQILRLLWSVIWEFDRFFLSVSSENPKGQTLIGNSFKPSITSGSFTNKNI